MELEKLTKLAGKYNKKGYGTFGKQAMKKMIDEENITIDEYKEVIHLAKKIRKKLKKNDKKQMNDDKSPNSKDSIYGNPSSINPVSENIDTNDNEIINSASFKPTTFSHFPEPTKSTEGETDKITPKEYFEKLKSSITKADGENIKKLYNVAATQMKSFEKSGQISAAKRLYDRCKALEKEYKLIDIGITQYIPLHVIDYYIDYVSNEDVVIVELRNYERIIPDEIVEKINKAKDIIDEFYIIFTDYTGEKRSQIEKERREKDPILIGNIFIDNEVSEKMYLFGSWEDSYCHLTVDSMIEEMAVKSDETNVVYDIGSSSIDDIKNKLFEGMK